MKLNEIFFKKFLTNFCIIMALIACGSNAYKLRDSGKSIKSANSINNPNEIFLETESVKKKKTKKNIRKNRAESESKTVSKTKWATGTQNTPPVAVPKAPYKNDTLSKSIWRDINNTMVRQKINIFLNNHRKWDFKLLDSQLQDIAMDMNYREEYGHTQEGLRSFIRFFINYFEACDKDGDNLLSRAEFRNCMKNDTFLAIIDVPSKNYSALSAKPLDYTNSTIYADILFDLLDLNDSGFLNFHSYMQLRLYIFSWRRCSVAAPFIDETNFECAIEIAAGWKTMNRNTVRKIFFLSLEMSGNINIRNLDFVTFVNFAQSVRIFGKINGKEDNDVTRTEFNLALDSGILPIRYNQDTIDIFFRLIEDKGLPATGIDVFTFCFYDFFLKVYHKQAPKGTYFLNVDQFIPIFKNQLMPYFVNLEFSKIPQNKLNKTSYQMYTYFNVSNYQDESDHFLKSFLEKSSEVIKKTLKSKSKSNSRNRNKNKNTWSVLDTYKNQTNFQFNANETFTFLFQVIDSDMDGLITFYDFGNMMQIAYLFTKFDKFYKGRNTAGELYERFLHYSDLPIVSSKLKQRAAIFNEFPQDLYVDVFSAILTLKIQDLMDAKVRRIDKTLCTEIELKHVLALVNRKYVPDAFLNRCLRGSTKDNIPMYDWECAFVQSEISTMTFYENSIDRLTVSKNTLNLQNTVFYNIDPSLPQQGTIPGEEKHHGYDI